jgi:hypothetical protein
MAKRKDDGRDKATTIWLPLDALDRWFIGEALVRFIVRERATGKGDKADPHTVRAALAQATLDSIPAPSDADLKAAIADLLGDMFPLS